MSSGFMVCFGITIFVMNREGTKMCPILYGSEIWAILGIITRKCVWLSDLK